MVDHFHESVFLPRKIDGHARAMVVTDGVDRAIAYHHAISAYIKENGYPYRSIIAFSGDRQHQGQTVNEASLNGFPSTQIPDKIQEDPYRILICADKFQTGYDEPLLHTMYVDKTLAGIKAVQTLSRLNRARPNKSDTFVLDFMNSSDVIRAAFADYYRTTMLANETDPNKLHDLKANLDSHQVYTPQQVDELVEGYLSGKDRGELDPIADTCVEPYKPSARTDRSSSKARPKHSQGSTHSSPRYCLTPIPNGKNCPSFSTSSFRSCRRRWTRTCPSASSKPSTWTVTGPRNRQPSGYSSTMRMRRSPQCPQEAVATATSRNWHRSRKSSPPSTNLGHRLH